MTLEQMYYTAEIVATIAIIISLIYVGLQIRQNTQAMRISAAQTHMTAYSNVLSNLAQSKDLSSIVYRAFQDSSNLTGEEIVQYWAQLGIYFRNAEVTLIQWRSGAMDNRLMKGIELAMIDLTTVEGVRLFWKARRHWYSEEFQNWYESLASKETPHQMYAGQEDMT